MNHVFQGSIYPRNEDGEVMYPFASKVNCTITFDSFDGVKKHMSSVHKGEKISCTVVTQGCTGAFTRVSGLSGHIRRCHRPHQFAGLHCTDAFCRPGDLKKHITSVHEKIRFPCPFANELGCNQAFSSKSCAQRHTKYSTFELTVSLSVCRGEQLRVCF
jgi:hypothetical protein